TPGSSQPPPRRCAIYTRKSHEEGLEQAFNSLDAQREAGLDYIRSQKHEGWQVIDTHYDDGAYSGANIKRPAIQQLIDDIKLGNIDVIVVYKVDRLSRSLHDFAQLMKLFDEHNVSFVSVTQQFNTTTSMGRLTLNMLLSFAQFEREVTSERIRDKLAATKKKGLWVTGQPPLGYKAVNKELQEFPEDAKLVNLIFQGYLEFPGGQSLLGLADHLNAQGHTTKQWTSTRGITHGGKPLTPKYLYRVLTNPIYIGKITHKQHVWPGKHKPIIPRKLWDQVQQAIDTQHRQTRHKWKHPYLLKGKLRTYEDAAMSPSSVHRPSKNPGGKKRLSDTMSVKKPFDKAIKIAQLKRSMLLILMIWSRLYYLTIFNNTKISTNYICKNLRFEITGYDSSLTPSTWQLTSSPSNSTPCKSKLTKCSYLLNSVMSRRPQKPIYQRVYTNLTLRSAASRSRCR
ncbi:MAG: recombinase family protein, partial [Phycisphaeraceae bacterium]|nr:recombinase family protein [Phycisphaeraceae bacterium]